MPYVTPNIHHISLAIGLTARETGEAAQFETNGASNEVFNSKPDGAEVLTDRLNSTNWLAS
jgi:hypothetical protein